MIPYVRIDSQAEEEIDVLADIFREVSLGGKYIGGHYVEKLEHELATYLNVPAVVTLNSGTDALMFALVAAGVKRGDEVITAPNSFIASAAAIAHVGAIPVFADVEPNQNISPDCIREKLTKKTKAIMPVHLTGRPCKMDEINEIAGSAGIAVIEDAAQSIGSEYKKKKTGGMGDFGCFSAHPLKNLNAIGDGGFLTTNDCAAATEIRTTRNHGLVDRAKASKWGLVSRMDSLQAAILSYRLTRLDEVIHKRRRNAELYRSILMPEFVFVPAENCSEFNTYHTFVIQTDDRDALKKYLATKGISTSVHYPIPIHLQPASSYLGYKVGDFPNAESQASRILTLPVNQYMTEGEIITVAQTVNKFFQTDR